MHHYLGIRLLESSKTFDFHISYLEFRYRWVFP
jgi:hypothetical protein